METTQSESAHNALTLKLQQKRKSININCNVFERKEERMSANNIVVDENVSLPLCTYTLLAKLLD